MRYKVVAFRANISNTAGASEVAAQLQALIAAEATGDWQYVRLETVETFVAGNSGCFGLGATPGNMTSHSAAVFQAT